MKSKALINQSANLKAAMNTAKKIMDGLKDALTFSQCNHIWFWDGYDNAENEIFHCSECNARKTEVKSSTIADNKNPR